jgi:hypothetical protein
MGNGKRWLSLCSRECRGARHVRWSMVGARQPLSVLQKVPVYAPGVVGDAQVRRRFQPAHGPRLGHDAGHMAAAERARLRALLIIGLMPAQG